MSTVQEVRVGAKGYVFRGLGWETAAQHWATCKVVATSNLSLTGAATIDSVSLSNGQLVLATAQTNPAQNGPWVVVTGGAWTRPATILVNGLIWYVTAGTLNSGTLWQQTQPPLTAFTLGTSTILVTAAPSTLTTTLTADENKQPRAILVDTTYGALGLTLPQDFPYAGLEFFVADSAPSGSFATNNLTLTGGTVNSNTVNINGSSTLVLATNFETVKLRYNGLFYNVQKTA